MRNKWMKRGLTAFLIVAVCCCFMPGLAMAAEGGAAESSAPAATASEAASAQAQTPAPASAKCSAAVKAVLAQTETVKDVTTTAAADKKDKSQLDIKTVNGAKEDVKVQVFLWKYDKTLTDTKKANDKKEKAGEITVAGLDKKTGEVTLNGTKVKLVDGKDGRYLEYTVKAGKTADLKIKLEPAEGAKDKTPEAAVEVKASPVKAEAAPAAAPAVTEGTQTNTNAAAGETDNASKDAAGGTETGTEAAAADGTETDPDKVEISVMKVWNDENDKDKVRPAKVTVKLFTKEGETLTDTEKTLILVEAANWKGSFEDLDKQKDGKDIEYTVQEVEVRDYTAAVTGDAATGFIVTNTHTPAAETEKVTVSGTITWTDSNDAKKKRPSSVTIRLYDNNLEIKNTKVTADNEWKYSFEDLDKLDSNGNEITYTIKQDAVSGYTTTYKGYDVTNKYKTTSSSSSTSKKTSGTTSNKNRTSSKNAKTGDSTHIGLYLALMILAAGGAAAMIYRRRRG